jgi:hypothetical protein
MLDWPFVSYSVDMDSRLIALFEGGDWTFNTDISILTLQF